MATGTIRNFCTQNIELTHSITVAANQNYSANFKTLVDNELPSGYSFLALTGYMLNNGVLTVANLAYTDSPYSFTVRNTSNASVSATVRFYIVAANI